MCPLFPLNLIGTLDERGFLMTDLPRMAQELGLPLERLEVVLDAIQHVGPPGIGPWRKVIPFGPIELYISSADVAPQILYRPS